MFQDVSNKTDFARLEEEILRFWNEDGTFKKSIANREGAPDYVFYDGPPFATGLPHYGHLLAGTIKDIVPRYWTMQGRRVERRFGWDCHGLPVENEATKYLKDEVGLDLSGKYEIENYGVDKYNEYCRSIVLKYTAEWERVVNRMGRWVDFENGYRTMDKSFMESIWWVFKQLWEKKLVYQGYRVTAFSWKLSTPLSNFEAGLNYQDVQDPAVTLKFELDSQPNCFILAWTTTPWTLPSNLALAVGPDIDYVSVLDAELGERYILAKARLEHYQHLLKRHWTVEREFKGSDLLGLGYRPLFEYYAARKAANYFRVIASDHVTTEDGTGIVHMAPAFGEDDFWACRRENIELVDPVDMEGRFTEPVVDFAGMNIKEADKPIVRALKEAGKLLHQGVLQHSYPFCWRTNTPLIYKAIKAWYVKVEDLKDRLVANNQQIQWVPEFVGGKRFGNWLENARDWNISRNRYWGTPLPIWQSEDGSETMALGSVAELEALTGEKVEDLHSHYIDRLSFEKDGKRFKRVAEVFDCWFESGAMPYAQNHYPFENKAYFEANFPADFIAEGLDQTRGWFYTLHILSTALFDKPAFKNVVVNGLILAADGQKMSKSKKNYPDPMLIVDKYGADCLRSYLINSPVVRAEPLRFQEEGLQLIARSLVLPLWNAYYFFTTYARLDLYQPKGVLTGSDHELDRWILSKFQSLVKGVTENMTNNHLYAVVPRLQDFIDLMNNWYIRRSRRRFWRAGNDLDKIQAYNTLYYILLEFSKVMAPFMPFLCEAIYRNLAFPNGTASGPESVHLCNYPVADEALIDETLETEMELVRKVVELGRSLRVSHNLKIRQPLAKMSLVAGPEQAKTIERLKEILADELNLKEVVLLADETSLISYAARPNFKAIRPELKKHLKQLDPLIKGLGHAEILTLKREGKIHLEGHELLLEELLIDHKERPEQAVASGEGVTLALDTHLTPTLLLEGDARELVSRIQQMRKEMDLAMETRIHLRVESAELAKALEDHGEYIARETLALSFNGQEFEASRAEQADINGKSVRIALRPA